MLSTYGDCASNESILCEIPEPPENSNYHTLENNNM